MKYETYVDTETMLDFTKIPTEDLDVLTADSNFWSSLSGKVEYSEQVAAWEQMCKGHGADPRRVLGLLHSAYEATRLTREQP